MRTLLIAAAALSLSAIVPASAQMAPMMGGGMQSGMRSCVSGGQFVPCPPGGGMQPGMMQPGMGMQGGMRNGMGMQGGMQEPGMAPSRKMSRRKMMRRKMRRMRRDM